jgi:hypothetical protein
MTIDTTTMLAPVLTHPVAVAGDGDEYRAECGCGWRGEWHFTPETADADGAWHRDDSARAGDAMDAVMSDLLDLQDDLAAVVVWLAENWTVGLPALGWTACGDDRDRERPALRVLGYASPAELAAAALVLETTATDDPPTEPGQNSYRHVMRDFGRVRLDVFTLLPALDTEIER